MAFHALRSEQLRSLQLTDLRDGRLYLPGRTILLAAPVRQRLAAWLGHRPRRWPHTVNSHLFINAYTAVRTAQVSNLWINQALGISPRPATAHVLHNDGIRSPAPPMPPSPATPAW